MKVLFSPLGNSDPWRNHRDGAMLHSVRCHKPEWVYLFFTDSIWEDRIDHNGIEISGHKHYDWEAIIHSVSPNTVVEYIVQAIDQPHNYDGYKRIFSEKLSAIRKAHPDAELLLNVTSGTPQMSATLCLHYVASPNKSSCLQVSAPTESSNAGVKFATPQDQEIDLDIVNTEEESATNRCEKINIVSFHESMVTQQLISLIKNYDYNAAFHLFAQSELPAKQTNFKKDLKSLNQSIQLHQVFEEFNEDYNKPHYSDLKVALTHFVILDMRIKRRDFAESLIRLKTMTEFITEQYLTKTYRGLIEYRYNKNKDRFPHFNPNYDKEFTANYIEKMKKKGWGYEGNRSLGLVNYLDFLHVLEPDSEFVKLLNKIQTMNQSRNIVAHQLRAFNAKESKQIEQLNQTLGFLKQLLESVYPEVKPHSFDFFKRKNTELIKLLS